MIGKIITIIINGDWNATIIYGFIENKIIHRCSNLRNERDPGQALVPKELQKEAQIVRWSFEIHNKVASLDILILIWVDQRG